MKRSLEPTRFVQYEHFFSCEEKNDRFGFTGIRFFENKEAKETYEAEEKAKVDNLLALLVDNESDFVACHTKFLRSKCVNEGSSFPELSSLERSSGDVPLSKLPEINSFEDMQGYVRLFVSNTLDIVCSCGCGADFAVARKLIPYTKKPLLSEILRAAGYDIDY